MKLLKKLALAVVMAGVSMIAVNNVEAANVAVLPLVNNVVDREDFNAIYFDRAVEVTKQGEGFEIIDGDILDNAVAKNVKAQQLPDKQACEAIATAANIDYVIAMQVDSATIKEIYNLNADDIMLSMRGRFVSYNAITGKYINKSIVEDDKIQGALLARYDMSGNQFGNSVTREIKKALGIKKFVVEKQRIGLKGDRK